jgi:hypothetical protein
VDGGRLRGAGRGLERVRGEGEGGEARDEARGPRTGDEATRIGADGQRRADETSRRADRDEPARIGRGTERLRACVGVLRLLASRAAGGGGDGDGSEAAAERRRGGNEAAEDEKGREVRAEGTDVEGCLDACELCRHMRVE